MPNTSEQTPIVIVPGFTMGKDRAMAPLREAVADRFGVAEGAGMYTLDLYNYGNRLPEPADEYLRVAQDPRSLSAKYGAQLLAYIRTIGDIRDSKKSVHTIAWSRGGPVHEQAAAIEGRLGRTAHFVSDDPDNNRRAALYLAPAGLLDDDRGWDITCRFAASAVPNAFKQARTLPGAQAALSQLGHSLHVLRTWNEATDLGAHTMDMRRTDELGIDVYVALYGRDNVVPRWRATDRLRGVLPPKRILVEENEDHMSPYFNPELNADIAQRVFERY